MYLIPVLVNFSKDKLVLGQDATGNSYKVFNVNKS